MLGCPLVLFLFTLHLGIPFNLYLGVPVFSGVPFYLDDDRFSPLSRGGQLAAVTLIDGDESPVILTVVFWTSCPIGFLPGLGSLP